MSSNDDDEFERRIEQECAVLAEDLRKTKAERDRLLPFVIQRCLNCGAVTAPFETMDEATAALIEYRTALAALPLQKRIEHLEREVALRENQV